MSRRTSRMLLAGASVAALALGLTLSAADATRIVRIASHISIASHGLKFSGHVTSSRSPCIEGRKVTLFRTNGNELGTDTTDVHGKWEITAQGSAGISLGHFYAKVKRRSEGTAGTIFVCKGATSPTIRMH